MYGILHLYLLEFGNYEKILRDVLSSFKVNYDHVSNVIRIMNNYNIHINLTIIVGQNAT